MVEWIVALIILVVFYRKIIVPFSTKMLEIKADDEIEEKKRVYFDEDELEDQIDKTADLKKKFQKELDLMSGDDEEKIRYEVLLEKLRERIDSDLEQSSAVITNLNKRD